MDENKPSQKYAYLNYLSTPELENLLRADLDAPTRDPERTLYILEVMEQRDSNNAAARQADTDRAWKEFQEYYNIPEGQNSSLYSSELPEEKSSAPASRKRHPRLRQIALIAAAIICLITLASAGDFIEFFKTVGLWSDADFHFVPAQSSMPISPSSQAASGDQVTGETYPTLEDALTAYSADMPELISDLLNDYVPKQIDIEKNQRLGFIRFFATYTNKNSSLSITITKWNTLQDVTYEKDENPVETFESGDITYYFYQNMERTIMAWSNGTMNYYVSSPLSIEKIKEFIN